MSATSHVFFDSSLDMDSLIKELAHILEAEILPPTDRILSYGFWVEAGNLSCTLDPNDYGLDYLSQQTYRFDLWIFPHGVFGEEVVDALIAGAKYVFEKLKTDGRFPVLAVFNLEEVLGEFIPEG